MRKRSIIKPVVTPKTVIFTHSGVECSLSKGIKDNAIMIKYQLMNNKEETLKYYEKAIMRAAMTDKQYIRANYTPMLAECFETLLSEKGNTQYKGWRFLTFFNKDTTEKTETRKYKRLNLYKRNFMLLMEGHDFIQKLFIPYGDTITEENLKTTSYFLEAA